MRNPILSDTFLTILRAPLFSSKKHNLVSYSQFKVAFLVLYVSGARVNEIRHLTKKDFDNLAETQRLPINQTKTHTARVAYLGPEARALFKEIENDLDLHITSHSLRIGFVTRLLSKLDIRKVSELVGHKSLQTTAQYNRFLLSSNKSKELTDSALFIDSDDLLE